MFPDYSHILHDNSICYALDHPTMVSDANYPWIPKDRCFNIVSPIQLINIAVSKIPDEWKQFSKYASGLKDHGIILSIDDADFHKTFEDLREDSLVRGCEHHFAKNIWILEIYLRDFHTNVGMSWSKK